MQKLELKEKLLAGFTLDELFSFGSGQDCEMYKADSFVVSPDIIYIPDLDLNEIRITKKISSLQEIDEVLSNCYTGYDFILECHGNREKAEKLFYYCDWQHPNSALPEVENNEEDDNEDDTTHHYSSEIHYAVLYSENTDCGDPALEASAKFFTSEQNAKDWMAACFHASNSNLQFTLMEKDDEHYIEITDQQIYVHDGYDTYCWQVIKAVAADI